MTTEDLPFEQLTIEDLQVLLAWEAGELSEGQAAKTLGLDRVAARDLRLGQIQAGVDRARQKGKG